MPASGSAYTATRARWTAALRRSWQPHPIIDDGPSAAFPAADWYRPLVHTGNFTITARSALHTAAIEAHGMGCAEIEPGHMLLGLLRTHGGFGGKAFARVGAQYAPIAQSIRRSDARRTLRPGRWMGLAAETARALDAALAEGRRHVEPGTGTPYLLLSILVTEAGTGARILRAHGVDAGGIVEELESAMRGLVQGETSRAAPDSARTCRRRQMDRRLLLTLGGTLTVVGAFGVIACTDAASTPRAPTPFPTAPPESLAVPGFWQFSSAHSASFAQTVSPVQPFYEPALGLLVTGQGGIAEGVEGFGGAVIEPALDSSQAARAGVKRGDVVVAVDGHETPYWREFLAYVQALRPGEEIELRIVRAGTDSAARTDVSVRLVIGR